MKPLIIALLLAPAAPAARAAVPTDAACAAEDMQLFYYYLAPQLEPKVKERATTCHPGKKYLALPDWLEKARPGMLERLVWRDPEQGELSEAVLWQTPVSILYEFAEKAGKEPDLLKMEAELVDMRLRYMMGLDRIYRAGLDGAFGGRGGEMAGALDGVMRDFDALLAAAAKKDRKAAEREAGGLLRHSRELFARLFSAPRPPDERAGGRYRPAPYLLPGYRGVTLPVSGSQALFLKAGDRADVLVTFEAVTAGEVKEKVAATILQNVVVLNAHKPESPEEKGAVQLLLNPMEAQYAALSLAQGSNIAVTRRAEGDVELHPMEIASFRRLFK